MVVKLLIMTTCHSPIHESYLEKEFVLFGYSLAFRKRSWPSWQTSIGTMSAESNEANVISRFWI